MDVVYKSFCTMIKLNKSILMEEYLIWIIRMMYFLLTKQNKGNVHTSSSVNDLIVKCAN
jgi:hypothetical protein